MGIFDSKKYKSLSNAVLAGDLNAARKMLEKGANPNQCDPDDSAYPIHYSIHHGPQMVQLLIDHGADVNIPARGYMPLASAEAQGYMDVAAILRRAGARLRTGEEDSALDPRIHFQIISKIQRLILAARMSYPTESAEEIARHVIEKLDLTFPDSMPLEQQEMTKKEIHALIMKECKN
ncbi:MAG: ankyrin repeat domain-containing protein [Chloroflexi bacterium]|nr:ankyrin repeat domain-containing protein [Chloroflexota bacterium]